MSQSHSWQTKFTQICQGICDIKSNNYSGNINKWKMTIMPTQLESTNYLDNHKPLDCDRNEGDNQDASCSPYKPALEMTMGHNSHNQINCDALLCGASGAPPQLPSLPPSYPDSPLLPRTPQWGPLQLPQPPRRMTPLSQRSCPHLLIPR